MSVRTMIDFAADDHDYAKIQETMNLSRELEVLRATIREHERAAKGDPSRLTIAAERLWSAAKVTP